MRIQLPLMEVRSGGVVMDEGQKKEEHAENIYIYILNDGRAVVLRNRF